MPKPPADLQRVRESLNRIGVILIRTERLSPVAGDGLRGLIETYLPGDLAQRCAEDFEVGFINPEVLILTRRFSGGARKS